MIELFQALFATCKWLWIAFPLAWLWFGGWLIDVIGVGWWTFPLIMTVIVVLAGLTAKAVKEISDQ